MSQGARQTQTRRRPATEPHGRTERMPSARTGGSRASRSCMEEVRPLVGSCRARSQRRQAEERQRVEVEGARSNSGGHRELALCSKGPES